VAAPLGVIKPTIHNESKQQDYSFVRASLCQHGESPVWHAERGELFWVDMLSNNLYQYHVKTKTVCTYTFDRYTACVTPCDFNNVLLAQGDGIYRFHLYTNKLTKLTEFAGDNQKLRFNELKCDPRGRIFAGTMAKNESPFQGGLHQFFDRRQHKEILDRVSIANGMAWSPDYKTFYFIDSPTRCILAFDYDIETGLTSNQRLCIDLSNEEGYPDGMTIDNEGHLWVAMWAGSQLLRVDPMARKVVQNIPMPVKNPTSCCFGGPGMSQLFVTSSQKDLDDEALKKYPRSGAVFVIDTHHTGCPSYLSNPSFQS
jgi:sugar lactone lactonase YvrE|tara:strand:+ start:3908 stop:4846 length:939 start_codon:yes stop_codon:yes gene_type:complete